VNVPPADGLRRNLERLRRRRPGASSRILFTRHAVGPLTLLAIRGLLVIALFATAMTAFWLDREGLKDAADGVVSLADVVYFTMVTVTTVGYGDIVPVSDSARMLDALLVTPIRIFVWFIFVGTAYQLVFQRVIEDFRMQRLQRRLTGHVVVCGYGNNGRSAVTELLSQGVPAQEIVVIERDEVGARTAIDRGVVALHGDATGEEMLRIANVDRARGLVVAVGSDDASLMIVVTARAIGTPARIVASVHRRENVKLLRNAGATVTITPWTYSGYLLADGVTQEHTVDLIQDALSHEGTLRMSERPPRPDEIGQPARSLRYALLYGLVRDGRRVMFWEDPGLLVQAGDVLIVVDAGAGATQA
jgi:voltage-gated potassium channel